MYHSEFARRLRSQSAGASRGDPLGSAGTSSPHGDVDDPYSARAGPSRLAGGRNGADRPATGSSSPLTPRKGKGRTVPAYGDRFIPNRDGSDLQAAYQLIDEEPLTPGGRAKRRMVADVDAQTEEANETYSMLLSSELFGPDAGVMYGSPSSHTSAGAAASPSRAATCTSINSPPAGGTRWGGGETHSLPTTPSRRNLFSFRSPSPHGSTTPTRSRERRGTAASSARLRDAASEGLSASGSGGHISALADPVLYGGLGAVRDEGTGTRPSTPSRFPAREQIDSPVHTAYSTSPVKPESQRLLLSARKPTRSLSKVPYKVLDAPELADDFYLNLVDWSSEDVLGVGLGKCVYLWSARTSAVTKLCDLQGMQDSITGLAWSDRGNHLAVGTQSGLVQIWDAGKEKLLRTMMGHTARVGALAWNNSVLSTGSRDRCIYHRDVRVPEHHVKTLLAHRQEVCGLKWNAAQGQLASGGNDNRLFVWDGLSETPLHRFTEHTAAVKAIAWSPHQQGLLASGGGTADMKIRFWNTQTGAALSEIDTGSQVCNLAWNKTANEVISTHGYSSGNVHNQIQLWRYPSLSHFATLTGHTMRVLYLAMSPSGKSIVTGAGDETLRFWDLNTPARDRLDRRDDRSIQSSLAKLR